MHQSILDSDQYSPRSIRRYERIFGTDFVSSGGLETTTHICAELGLRPGTRVLDVGCGLGGSAFHMNRTYGARVTGVDILPQMVTAANQRVREYGLEGVSFIEGDILSLTLPEVSFDLVYSRDAFLYIEDKLRLFQTLFRLLAPQGRLFVSDYACGPGPLSEEFQSYASGAGYYLRDLQAYGEVIREAGFDEVQARDVTPEFVGILQREMEDTRALSITDESDADREDREYLLERWQRKVRWCTDGDMKWVHLLAKRD